ncbi:MAG: hypothetical protein OJF51_001501 [Nitrospira sp.]|nr:MAG: hypothetical protein OJF51_001501 [Nitrospira sp.]
MGSPTRAVLNKMKRQRAACSSQSSPSLLQLMDLLRLRTASVSAGKR